MKISLKEKKLRDTTSLFIEYYFGSTISLEGKKIHDRKQEYLKIYLHNSPTSNKEKRDNKENLGLAENILSIRKSEYLKGKFDIKQDKLGEKLFLDYFSEKKEERYQTKANYDNCDAAEKHLLKFCPSSLSLNSVDENFVQNLKKYIDTEANCNIPICKTILK